MNKEITVYSKPGCGGCTFTKRHLEDNGVDFKEIDVTKDSEGLARVKSLGYSGLPVVEYKDIHFNGYQPNELDKVINLVKKEG